jgi:hypothetical protein
MLVILNFDLIGIFIFILHFIINFILKKIFLDHLNLIFMLYLKNLLANFSLITVVTTIIFLIIHLVN